MLHDSCGFMNRKQEICNEKKSDFLKVIMSGDSGEIDELLWDQIIGLFNILIKYSQIIRSVNFSWQSFGIRIRIIEIIKSIIWQKIPRNFSIESLLVIQN